MAKEQQTVEQLRARWKDLLEKEGGRTAPQSTGGDDLTVYRSSDEINMFNVPSIPNASVVPDMSPPPPLPIAPTPSASVNISLSVLIPIIIVILIVIALLCLYVTRPQNPPRDHETERGTLRPNLRTSLSREKLDEDELIAPARAVVAPPSHKEAKPIDDDVDADPRQHKLPIPRADSQTQAPRVQQRPSVDNDTPLKPGTDPLFQTLNR